MESQVSGRLGGLGADSGAQFIPLPTRRILLVDPEPFNIISLRATIKQLGPVYKKLNKLIDPVYSGKAAMNKIKQGLQATGNKQVVTYGLVITGIHMPVVSGYDLADGIRSFYTDNRVAQPMVVATTTHLEQAYIRKAWSHAIDEVLVKPIDNDLLQQVLEQMVQT